MAEKKHLSEFPFLLIHSFAKVRLKTELSAINHGFFYSMGALYCTDRTTSRIRSRTELFLSLRCPLVHREFMALAL